MAKWLGFKVGVVFILQFMGVKCKDSMTLVQMPLGYKGAIPCAATHHWKRPCWDAGRMWRHQCMSRRDRDQGHPLQCLLLKGPQQRLPRYSSGPFLQAQHFSPLLFSQKNDLSVCVCVQCIFIALKPKIVQLQTLLKISYTYGKQCICDFPLLLALSIICSLIF